VTDDGCFGVVEEDRTTKSDLAAGGPIPSSFWRYWDRAADSDRRRASRAVSTLRHPVGTCAIGAESESGSVSDALGIVHGIEGLTMADALIRPTVPTGTPNLPTVMEAEHIAWRLKNS